MFLFNRSAKSTPLTRKKLKEFLMSLADTINQAKAELDGDTATLTSLTTAVQTLSSTAVAIQSAVASLATAVAAIPTTPVAAPTDPQVLTLLNQILAALTPSAGLAQQTSVGAGLTVINSLNTLGTSQS